MMSWSSIPRFELCAKVVVARTGLSLAEYPVERIGGCCEELL